MSHTVVVGPGRGGGRGHITFRSLLSDARLNRLLSDSGDYGEYRSLDSVASERRALTDEMFSIQDRGGNTLIPRTLLKFCDVLEEFSRRMSAQEERFVKVDKAMEDQSKVVDSHWEWLQQNTEHTAETLFQLMETAKLLEGIAFEHQPSSLFIKVRRHLDDARFCVADMFMLLFPNEFPSGRIVNVYDTDEGSLIWFKFKELLRDHFHRYHEIRQNRKKSFELVQVYSVFWGIDETYTGNVVEPDDETATGTGSGEDGKGDEAEGSKDDEAKGKTDSMDVDTQKQEKDDSEDDKNAEPQAADPSQVTNDPQSEEASEDKKEGPPPTIVVRNFEIVNEFTPKRVATCTEKGNAIGWDADQHLRYQLEFFKPLLGWMYNFTKRKLSRMDAELKLVEGNIKLQDEIITHLRWGGDLRGRPRSQGVPDLQKTDEELFAVGTAYNTRKNENWRKYVLANRKMMRPKAPTSSGSKKRKAEDTTEGRGGSKSSPKLGATSALSEEERAKISFSDDIRAKVNAPGSVYVEDEAGGPSKTGDDSGHHEPSSPGPVHYGSPPSEHALSTSPPTASAIHGGAPTVSGAAPQKDTFVDYMIENTIKEKERLKQYEKTVKELRRVTLNQYRIYKKGVRILFNDNMLKLVMMGGSFVRRVTNHFAHLPNEPGEKLAEALTISKLIEQSGLSQDADDDMDYEAELNNITDIVFDDNENPIGADVASTEAAIDAYVARQAARIRPFEKTTDIHVFLGWLDTLFPIPEEESSA